MLPDTMYPGVDFPGNAEPPRHPCTTCGGPAFVRWLRRLTAAEVLVEQGKEQARRDLVIAEADPQKPQPIFPPLPDHADSTITVYGCLHHAITKHEAALIHQASCTACDCTPEPTVPEPRAVMPPLPPGWA